MRWVHIPEEHLRAINFDMGVGRPEALWELRYVMPPGGT